MFVTKKRTSSLIALIAMISAAESFAAEGGGAPRWGQWAWNQLPTMPTARQAAYYGTSALLNPLAGLGILYSANMQRENPSNLQEAIFALTAGNLASTFVDRYFIPNEEEKNTAYTYQLAIPMLLGAALAYNSAKKGNYMDAAAKFGGLTALGLSTPGFYTLPEEKIKKIEQQLQKSGSANNQVPENLRLDLKRAQSDKEKNEELRQNWDWLWPFN